MADAAPVILTLGHSTRPIDEFLDLLEHHQCMAVVDVRSLPRSRRYPHFDLSTLRTSLAERGIGYRHCASLGGLRRPLPKGQSVNTGLRNERFRAYADHMQTAEFADALEELIRIAHAERTALLCAEAVPWHCHRSLLADALVARGWRVLHVIDGSRVEWHRLHDSAAVADGRIFYPSDRGQLPLSR